MPIELESGNNVHLNNVLYVPGLKKNLVSISCLEDKGDRVEFVDGKVLVWPKGSSINNSRVISTCEGRLYRLLKQPTHRRYAHLHYKVVPTLNQLVHGIPDIKEDREGVCKGCSLGKHTRKPFSKSETLTTFFTN